MAFNAVLLASALILEATAIHAFISCEESINQSIKNTVDEGCPPIRQMVMCSPNHRMHEWEDAAMWTRSSVFIPNACC